MKILSSMLRLLWVLMLSMMIAGGIVALLSSRNSGYGLSIHRLAPLPWLFWMVSVASILIIVDIVLSDLGETGE